MVEEEVVVEGGGIGEEEGEGEGDKEEVVECFLLFSIECTNATTFFSVRHKTESDRFPRGANNFIITGVDGGGGGGTAEWREVWVVPCFERP